MFIDGEPIEYTGTSHLKDIIRFVNQKMNLTTILLETPADLDKVLDE